MCAYRKPIVPSDILQYNATLQLMDHFYNGSQTGGDVEKVEELVSEVCY